jgi:hypothetical protein
MHYTEAGAIVWSGISHAAMVRRRAANCRVAIANYAPMVFGAAAPR